MGLWAHFTNMDKLGSKHGYVITYIKKFGMKQLIDFQTSSAQTLRSGHG